MALSSRLNSTATIFRKTRTTDNRGGSTITYTTATSNVSCRVSMKSSSERFLGDKVDSSATHKIFVLSSVTVQLHDRFTIGSDNFHITGINKPSRGDHFELDAELIRSE